MKDKQVLRFSTADIEFAELRVICEALAIGGKFLKEISIHFCRKLHESPFQPGGDHYTWLQYL